MNTDLTPAGAAERAEARAARRAATARTRSLIEASSLGTPAARLARRRASGVPLTDAEIEDTGAGR